MKREAQQLLDSLLSYQFRPSVGKPWSHVALFKEYTRRMAWWADALSVMDNWVTLNIAYVLELDDEISDEPLQKLDRHLQSQALYQPMPNLLMATMMYAMVADEDIITQYGLENPYDALVKLYTRGGYIRWNQRGFWEVSGAFGVGGIDLATYKLPKPFVALDNEELDLLDNDDPSLQ